MITSSRSPLTTFCARRDIYHVDKDEGGKVTRKKMYGVRYVPLTDADKQWKQS